MAAKGNPALSINRLKPAPAPEKEPAPPVVAFSTTIPVTPPIPVLEPEPEELKTEDLSPEEVKAVTRTVVEDAVTNPAAEVVPQATPATLKTIASLYETAEAALQGLHEGSCHLTEARQHVLVWHGGRIHISEVGTMYLWNECNSGLQAERAKFLPKLLSQVTELSILRNARIAADLSKA